MHFWLSLAILHRSSSESQHFVGKCAVGQPKGQAPVHLDGGLPGWDSVAALLGASVAPATSADVHDSWGTSGVDSVG